MLEQAFIRGCPYRHTSTVVVVAAVAVAVAVAGIVRTKTLRDQYLFHYIVSVIIL